MIYKFSGEIQLSFLYIVMWLEKTYENRKIEIFCGEVSKRLEEFHIYVVQMHYHLKFGEDSMRNKAWRVTKARKGTWKHGLEVLLVSINRDLIHNFRCVLLFGMIYIFMWSEETFEKREIEKYWWHLDNENTWYKERIK